MTSVDLLKSILDLGPIGVSAVILYFHTQTRKDLERERSERILLQDEITSALRRVPRIAKAINGLSSRIDTLSGSKATPVDVAEIMEGGPDDS